MGYFIIMRFKDFLNATVTTSFFQNDVDSLEMPTITICSLNTYDDTDVVNLMHNMKDVLHINFIKLRDSYNITGPVSSDVKPSATFSASRMNAHILLSNFLLQFIEFKYELYRNVSSEPVRPQVFSKHFYTQKILAQNDHSMSFNNYLGRTTFGIALQNTFATHLESKQFITCQKQVETFFWPLYMEHICESDTFEDFQTRSNLVMPTEVEYALALQLKYYFKYQNCHKNLTLPEKCRQIHFSQLIFDLDSYDFLIRSIGALDKLSIEIVFDFIYGTLDIDQQLANYGPYFQEILKLADFTEFKKLARQFFEIAPQFKKDPQNVGYFSVIMAENKPPEDDFRDIALTLNSMRSFITEGTKKSMWMSQVTNVDAKKPINPPAFKRTINIWNWYTSSRDPEDNSRVISNFSVGQQGSYYSLLNPSEKLLNAKFADEDILIQDHFEKYISPRSSLCYRTKMDLSKFQTSNGENNGFRLTLFTGNNQLGTDDGEPFAMQSSAITLSTTPMFEISIDHPKAILTDVTTGPIMVEPGKITKIALKRERRIRSPNVKDHPCNATQTDFLSDRQISFLECRQQCFLKYVYFNATCHCIPAYGLNYIEKLANSTYHQDECTYEKLATLECYNDVTKFKSFTMSEIKDVCNCDNPCDSISYQTQVTSSHLGMSRVEEEFFFSRDYDYLMEAMVKTDFDTAVGTWFAGGFPGSEETGFNSTQNLYLTRALKAYSMHTGHSYASDVKVNNRWLLANGIAQVLIYFENLVDYQIIETDADLPSSLVSDLGGQLGLWLGVSMVSIMEICLFCGIFFRRKPKRLAKNDSNTPSV